MGLRIQTNVASLIAQRQLGANHLSLVKSFERLSSGLRINHSADDAAGLAVANKMRTRLLGFGKAIHNAQDGINLLQTAESGIEQANNILQRMRELAIQAANYSYTHTDRQKIQEEITQLRLELTRISQTTEFNARKLLDGSVQNAWMGAKATAEIVTNIRVGGQVASIPEVRNFIAGIQAMTTNVTVDTAIVLKIIASPTASVTMNAIGMEVYSSVLGLLTTVNDISQLPSSSFGISLDSLTAAAGLLTIDINKGELLTGPVDRSTPLSSLMSVQRLGTVIAGNLTMSIGGTPYTIAVNPATDSINSIIAAFNGLSNPIHTISATFDDVTSRFSVLASRVALTTLTATVPYTDMGGGPPLLAWGPAASILDPNYANPAGPGALNLAMNFGGTSGLANALLLPNVADTPDDSTTTTFSGVGVQTGFAPPLTFNTYDLTTTEVVNQTDTQSSTSGQPLGGSFKLTIDDIGKMAMIHVAARKDPITTDNSLSFHVGANEGQVIRVGIDELSAKALRVEDITVVGNPILYKGNADLADFLQAEEAIGVIDQALGVVQSLFARLGAAQQRLEYTLSNLQVEYQNLAHSESRIRDADIAVETAALTKSQILVQASTAFLSQANVSSQSVLRLLSSA